MERIPGNPVLVWIANRIKKNKNAIIVVNGSTGSGKSYASIELARQVAATLGTNFTISNNLDFHFTNLLRKMMLPENKKAGTPFVFEEVGSFSSGSSSREWQSEANKFFFSFMQTSRHKNQILIFNCPQFSFLEKGARSLVHMQLEMEGIDYNRSVAFARPYRVQINSRSGQFYFKYLRCIHDGMQFKFKRLELQMPPADMVKEYEQLKTRFTGQLNMSIIKKTQKEVTTKRDPKVKVNDKALQKLIDKGLNAPQMAAIMGVSTRSIVRHRNKLRNMTEGKAE